MAIQSINPATEQLIQGFDAMSREDVEQKLAAASVAQVDWRQRKIGDRTKLLKKAADQLRDNKQKYAQILTEEMGKPITQAVAEVEKCAWVCDYYAETSENFLTPKPVETESPKSYVRFDPLGVVFAIMPWNFPFWQVFRFAAPALAAGNTGLLKHASNVPRSALAIEEIFKNAGAPDGVFTTLLIESSAVAEVINSPHIAAVTLTGSEGAGSATGEAAGKALKKSVLELGGSDPFIVLGDADVDKAAEVAALARNQNTGQSCIAAKRFIVVEDVVGQFTEQFVKQVEALKVGDPSDTETGVGPLARGDLRDELDKQVQNSVKAGAKLLTGGKSIEGKGYFYQPTILGDVKPGMPAYEEELFGPVASVIIAKDDDDAVQIANDSKYGLGSSVWTKDTKKAEKIAGQIESGSVFINKMVASDPRLPFGGVKASGYGRELAEYGQREFINIKTVVVENLE